MPRPRLRDWLNPTRIGAKAHVRADDGFAYRHLLAALRSNAPGQWSQNPLEQARHFTSAVFLAINTLAKQAENAEFKIFERDDDPDNGLAELPYSDPLCRLFEDPNPEDGLGDLLYQITQQLALSGISLVWAPRDNPLGLPSELYSIPTATALPQPPSPEYPGGSYLVQPYYPYGGYPVVTTPQVANNRTKGGGNNLTYVAAGMWSDFLIAMFGSIEFAQATQGDTVFGSDQVAVRAILSHDGGARHPGAFAVADQLVVDAYA